MATASSVPITDRVARTADGEPLAYRVHGTTGKTPILTVHGLVSSVHHWMFFNPHYSPSRPVVSWDYRGHGGQSSPRDCRSASVAQFAEDSHAVWGAANVGPSVVVGLSFGVQVALEMWRRYPETIRALVLICGTAGHPLDGLLGSPVVRRAVARLVRTLASQRVVTDPIFALLRSRVGMRIAREIAFLVGGAHRNACPPEVLEGLFGHVGALDPALFGAITAGYLEHSAYDVLPTITVPTLIIASDRDQLTPVATAERMHRAIPNSELVVIPDHTHLVQVERPREVHAAIDEFLLSYGL